MERDVENLQLRLQDRMEGIESERDRRRDGEMIIQRKTARRPEGRPEESGGEHQNQIVGWRQD